MEQVKLFAQSLLSRKFLVAIIGAVIVFGNAMYGWGLNEDEVWAVLTPLLTFIGVEGAADFKSRAKGSVEA